MLSKCLTFLPLVLVTLTVVADGRAAEPKQPEVQTLSIGPEAFGAYPAVYVSLDEGKLYSKNKKGKISDGRNLSIDHRKSPIDLWIEPRDPEIAVFSYQGRAQIGLLEVDFDKVERLPDGIAWLAPPGRRTRFKQPLLKPGFVFFVRSALGKVYKVRIDALDPMAQTMKLSYARLPQSASAVRDTHRKSKASNTNTRLVGTWHSIRLEGKNYDKKIQRVSGTFDIKGRYVWIATAHIDGKDVDEIERGTYRHEQDRLIVTSTRGHKETFTVTFKEERMVWVAADGETRVHFRRVEDDAGRKKSKGNSQSTRNGQ